MNKHVPVLLPEVIENLLIKPGMWYVDATCGGGGYTAAILQHGGKVLSIDADAGVIERENKLRKEEVNWIGVVGNFRHINKIVEEAKLINVQGIVFDLGLSSNQLDDEKRGFSYRFDAPLDMRYDIRQDLTAWKVINIYQEKLLYEIFASFGEEQHSQRLAHAICVARSLKKIDSTFELIDVVKAVVGINFKALGRVFQAIRMEVNDEISALKEGLQSADQVLDSDGILSVVSFHSLEDRIVKQFIRNHSYKIITRKPILPGENEMAINSRSHSAKLRVGQKISLV